MMMRTKNAGRTVRRSRQWLVLAVVLAVTACDDPFGPQLWDGTPVAMTLYSASRAEYTGLVSALDLVAQPVSAVSIEAPGALGNWDVVLLDGPDGLVLATSTAFEGAPAGGRIAMLPNRTFLEVTEAPSDTAAYSAGPVPLRTDAVYVIRSRRASCGFSSGVRYAKVQPIEVDRARGIFRFAVSRNPYCEDRSLVPPTA
jgi:hypothetical protein